MKSKACKNIRIIVTCTMLILTQLLKLVYFSLIMVDLYSSLGGMLTFTNLFEITSLYTLLGAFLSELYYWFQTFTSVHS